MLKRNIKYTIICAITIIGMYSCTDDFEEINTDMDNVSPTALEDLSPLLTQVQRHAFVEARYNTWRGNLIFAGRFAEQFSFGFTGTWFGNGAGFSYDNKDWNDAAWNTPMGEVTAPLSELLRLSTEEGNKFKDPCTAAVIKIIKGFFYQRMTDQFGAVPYIDGGKGFPPAFETQEEVYNLILDDLTDAINTLKGCNGVLESIENGDMVYQGDASKWLAAANTLRLRMALRSREANGGNQSHIDAALADPFISSSEGNFKIAQDPSNADPVFNGYYSIWNTWQSCCGPAASWVVSETLVESFKPNNDPRLFGFAMPIVGGTEGVWGDYIGGKVASKSEYSNTVSFDNLSKPNDKMWNDDTFPYITMTYAEAELLQAEAKYLKGDAGAQTHFEEAIRANATDWDVSSSLIEEYIANESSAQLSVDPIIANQQIGLNRWYAVYTNGYEAWSVMRRFDLDIFPDKTYTAANEWADTTGGVNNKMGKRINYSLATKSQNPEAVEYAISVQGPDEYSTNLWWDVK